MSACLAGVDCTYDAGNKLNVHIRDLVARGEAIVVCPEVLGGGTVPRERCEIVGGDGNDVLDGRAVVLTESGKDISATLLKGARRALSLAKKRKVLRAIMKSKSPSCGAGAIYDGTFSGTLRMGDGVTVALLRRNNIEVFTEKDGMHG